MTTKKPDKSAIKLPPKLYPDRKDSGLALPNPPPKTEADKRLIMVTTHLKSRMRDSPYYVTAEGPKRDIQKYIDKYVQNRSQRIDVIKAVPSSPMFFPAELLQPVMKKKAKASKTGVSLDRLLDLAAKRGALETKEDDDDAEKKEGEEEEGEGEDEEMEYMDEEEETDYNNNYFDDGDDAGGDDEGDEGATF